MKWFKENWNIPAIVLFLVWIAIMFSIGVIKNIKPDVQSDGGYEPAKTFGHPLWEDY